MPVAWGGWGRRTSGLAGRPTRPIVKRAVEDELGLVVAGVHNRTDLDGQADGGGATIH